MLNAIASIPQSSVRSMNILVLTSEYPNPCSKYDTPVVHYLVREWKNMSFNVKVLHYVSSFPRPFYWLAQLFLPIAKSFFRTDFIPLARISFPLRHVVDGVQVETIPLNKPFPHTRFSNSVILREINRLVLDNRSFNFVPDVILGHFANPQLELIPYLSEFYPSAKTSIVFHEPLESLVPLVSSRSSRLFRAYSRIGFRYPAMMENFSSQYGSDERYFVCPSGIPDDFILNRIPKQKFRNSKLTICFVGMLIPLKNVDVLIKAVYKAFPLKDFRLNIIGDGMEKDKLVDLSISLGLDKSIDFVGKISRRAVQDYLVQADIFVMVSAPEAFGLSYLEAMSKGCIAIGSCNQGIDGIIINGRNGFLCDPGNAHQLSSILSYIESLSYHDKILLAENALSTVKSYTNKLVAQRYIRTVCG